VTDTYPLPVDEVGRTLPLSDKDGGAFSPRACPLPAGAGGGGCAYPLPNSVDGFGGLTGTRPFPLPAGAGGGGCV
jgi:hypothetical protein